MHKIGVLQEIDGSGYKEVPHYYENVFAREKTTGPDRLVIGPASNHIDVLLDLAAVWESDFWLLYVLLVSRRGNESSRYQSPGSQNYEELKAFFRLFGDYLETDSRHHLWIGSTANAGTLVYDQHNVIYAYGPLDEYERRLIQRGFTSGPVKIPFPHVHTYRDENDECESKIMEHWKWAQFPLQDKDEE